MTVTLTQDNVLGRIRVDATGLAAADVASIERSTDQITWTMCRGGSAWPVTAGAFANPFDDYEFPDGVQVFYRVRGIETGAISLVSTGSSSTGSSGSRSPTMPAGTVDGDIVLIAASTRNVGTGTVDTPANWELLKLASGGAFAIFGRVKSAAWSTTPTITYTGGAANEDTIAQSVAFRRATLTLATSATRSGGSQQNIPFDALSMTNKPDNCLAIVAGWKQDDFTSADPSAGWTEIQEASSAAGNDASQVWDYMVQATATDIAAGTIVLTGGASAINRALTIVLEHAEYLNEQIEDITPALTGVWIKSLRRPFLNREVQVLDYSDIERPSRNAVFDIIGRTYPIGVADLMGSRRWTMTMWTDTLDDADDLDLVLASGDVWFIHVPVDCPVPGGYAVVDGGVTRRRAANAKRGTLRRFFDMPLVEVAAPDDDVAGTTGTWATVIASYATWEDLIADKATWADVLELIGSPSEVIVA